MWFLPAVGMGGTPGRLSGLSGQHLKVLPLPRRRPPRPESHDDRAAGRVASAPGGCLGDPTRGHARCARAARLVGGSMVVGCRRRGWGAAPSAALSHSPCALVDQPTSSALCPRIRLVLALRGLSGAKREHVVRNGHCSTGRRACPQEALSGRLTACSAKAGELQTAGKPQNGSYGLEAPALSCPPGGSFPYAWRGRAHASTGRRWRTR